jgi:hypothetical protein
MRTLIDDPLADKIIRGDFVSKDHIIVAVESNTNEERYLVFRKGTSSINEDTDASVNSLESRVLENLRSAPNSEEAGQQASQNPDETEQKTPNEQQQSNTNEPRQGRHAQAEAISPVLAMSAPVPRTANQEQAQGDQAPTPEKQANSQAEANINPALNNSEINPEAVTNEQGNLGPTPFNPHKPENLQQENQNPQINPGQDPEESIEDKIFKDIGDLDFD